MIKHTFRFALSLSLCWIMVAVGYGGVISWDFGGVEFSNSSGASDFLDNRVASVTISDIGTNLVRVELTMDPDGYYSPGGAGENPAVGNIGELYLNLVNPLDENVGNLVVTEIGDSSTNPYNETKLGTDNYKADGKDAFDIQVIFDNPFAQGVTSVFDLHLTSGTLTANDFLAKSEKHKDGGEGDFPMFAAIHLRTAGTEGISGFYEGTPSDPGSGPGVVPEPASFAVWSVLGLVGTGFSRRRRKNG